ncbi:DUF1993 domain-containing protein [Chitinimonas koreensis]|uniref:DUF1993 domain-containing protein n=1 Tax=Chitinimonas koreensis TaxID=356302 RepID=UPI0003FCEBCA|nr:DUF1993 domain-containing protein [Chitinimonas koreensis]QNM94751.1 DUF1993 domain-containing protein [Chitinimonas koreensis]
MPTLHAAAVPVFRRYLARLAALLDQAETHAAAHGLPPAELWQARLADDMLPFHAQVRTTADFALRSAAALAGIAKPDYGPLAADGPALRARIAQVDAFLAALPPERFVAEDSMIVSQAGEAALTLPAAVFLLHYALPNFVFHLTAAYAILRRHGVPIGKADFDGFHAYPAPAGRTVADSLPPERP